MSNNERTLKEEANRVFKKTLKTDARKILDALDGADFFKDTFEAIKETDALIKDFPESELKRVVQQDNFDSLGEMISSDIYGASVIEAIGEIARENAFAKLGEKLEGKVDVSILEHITEENGIGRSPEEIAQRYRLVVEDVEEFIDCLNKEKK